jgi:hypothetical protein
MAGHETPIELEGRLGFIVSWGSRCPSRLINSQELFGQSLLRIKRFGLSSSQGSKINSSVGDVGAIGAVGGTWRFGRRHRPGDVHALRVFVGLKGHQLWGPEMIVKAYFGKGVRILRHGLGLWSMATSERLCSVKERREDAGPHRRVYKYFESSRPFSVWMNGPLALIISSPRRDEVREIDDRDFLPLFRDGQAMKGTTRGVHELMRHYWYKGCFGWREKCSAG